MNHFVLMCDLVLQDTTSFHKPPKWGTPFFVLISLRASVKILNTMAYRSIEEQIEDLAKEQLNTYKINYFAKTAKINSEIDAALQKAPSKKGGSGNNYPDIKVLLNNGKPRPIPVMIEVKGREGDLVKVQGNGEIANEKDGKPDYTNISKYAVNGAVHYSNAVINYAKSFKEVIAIGVNGYNQAENIKTEFWSLLH